MTKTLTALLLALALSACGGGGDDYPEREQIDEPAKQPLVEKQ